MGSASPGVEGKPQTLADGPCAAFSTRVPQVSDSQPVRLPFASALSFIVPYADGRQPPVSCSVRRLTINRTGSPPASLESCAAAKPQRSAASFAPKPPPSNSARTRILEAGTPSALLICVTIPDTD